jgi:hypothetical protein
MISPVAARASAGNQCRVLDTSREWEWRFFGSNASLPAHCPPLRFASLDHSKIK